MSQVIKCIYCQQSGVEFCRAHVLPRSLGSFQNQPTLVNRVCAECDSAIGQYEDQFVHCGIATFMRPRLGLGGRSSFTRRHVGHGPIDLTTNGPFTGYEILVKPREQVQPVHELHQCEALPQLVIENVEGQTEIVRLFDDAGLKEITATSLKSDLKETGLTGRLKITPFGLTQEQEEYVFSLLKIEETESSGEEVQQHVIPVKSKALVTCDQRYFQAIAKVTLHYYLVSDDSLHTGHECQFEAIRRFIRYGEGEVDDFVQSKRGYLTRDTEKGWRPPYYGHIFVGSVNSRAITIKLKFFIGPDSDPPYYDVSLCRNPLTISFRPFSFGHNYAYLEPAERTKDYTGMMQVLGAANRIIIPRGL